MHPLSTPIYASSTARIGLFRCAANHPHFCHTGPIVSGHLIVFPRTAVRITLPHHDPIVAGPNTVLFYNLYQDYRRERLSADGDRCEWFAFTPTLLATALDHYEQKGLPDPAQPFRFAHAPSASPVYLQQRLIVDYLLQARQHAVAPDQLWVEEALLLLLDRVIEHAYTAQRQRIPPCNSQTQRLQRATVRALQEQLDRNFTSPLTLATLAAEVHHSPFELCRLFRAHTGMTIHQYLSQLRLRTALEWLVDSQLDLTTLALTLGYSSHSHFTSAFRHTFLIPPTALRNQKTLLEKLRNNLIV